MAVQMQFAWDLLKPEKELTDAQQALAREICETFLDTGAAVPAHQKKVQLGKNRNLINELAQLGLIRNNANQYYPTFQALYYCRSGLRDSYAAVLDLILKAIKALYESPSGPRRYLIKEVEQQMSLLVPTNAPEDIVQALKTDVHFARATVFLKDFTHLVSAEDSPTPDTPVGAVVAMDNILDYENLQQAWREELANRPGQPQNPIHPKAAEQNRRGEDANAPPRATQETPAEITPDVVSRLAKQESSGPNIQHGPSTHVSRDRWTTLDSLDHFPYAYAIYRFLTDEATQPPLSISIQAPWGGGKTSLMRMIQAQLDPEAAERADKINAKDKQIAPNATVANVEDEINKGAAFTNFAVPTKHENAQRRVTVWFNTWKYESTEQVWAGLADAIVQQVGERLGPVDRELFWFRLHLRRLDASRVRQRILRGITTRFLSDIVPWLWGYVSGPLLSLLIISVAYLKESVKLRGLGLEALLGTGLLDLIGAAIQASKAASEVKKEPAATNLGDLVAAPDYSANLGFVHEVVEDLRRVFEIIPTNLLPMVIFIDDLDRCSPKKVAAVVEAINLFLAGEFPDCMFILGIDDEMVAAALDQAHSDVIARLPGYAKSSSIGWRFMDKFVQLPFVIPPSGTDELKKYLDSLFPHSSSGNPIGIEMRDRAARFIEANEITKPVDQIVKEVSSGHPLAESQETTLKEEVRIIQHMQENIETFTDDEDAVKDVIAAETQKYFTNPRDLKRFVNLFRFYYFLRAAREARNERVATIEQMLRWLVLSLKWPEVVRWLRLATRNDESPGLTALEKVGHHSHNIDDWRAGIQNELGLAGDTTRWVSDEGLFQFFRAESALTPLNRLSMCGGRGLW